MNNGRILNCTKKYWSIWFVFLLFLTALIYILINQENIYVQIHDNLDSNVVWTKMVIDRGLFLSQQGEIGYLGGLDRSAFCSVISPIGWLYFIFPALPAYIIMLVLRILLSVCGWCMLSKLMLKTNKYFNISVLCGFLYGILPLFPSSSFCFASLPLLLYIIMQAERRGKVYDYIHLFLYPLLSSFAMFGMFICGYILLAAIFRSIYKKKICWRLFIALAVISLGYIIVSFSLFTGAVSGGATIRKEFSHGSITTFSAYWNRVTDVYVNSQYHSGSLHKYFVLPVCVAYFVIHNYNNIKDKNYKLILTGPFNILMYALAFNAAVYGLDEVRLFKKAVAKLIPYLDGYSFARILWLSPFIWYLAFFLVLCRMYKLSKSGKALSVVCIAAAFAVIFSVPDVYNDVQRNIANTVDKIRGHEVEDLTYGEFYSSDLFDTIKADIGYDYEYSAAYGMHPAVLNYNGIATIDGYKSTMSLEYKYDFREVIAPALEISEQYRDYFDGWGGRAYLFSDDVTYEPVRNLDTDEAELLINTDAFRELGGTYIFSRVKITNADEIEMDFVGHYENDSSPYDIYVYEVKEAN